MTESLVVAIAAEAPYDTHIVQVLTERILERPIRKWVGTYEFTGCKSVAKAAIAFLDHAAKADVQHAILAIDNDGGSKRRLEHKDDHTVLAEFKVDDDDACRECWLQAAIPPAWAGGGGKSCVMVPVQAIETWLLVLRGDELGDKPERLYARRVLKKKFYGGTPSFKRGMPMALEQLEKANALEILRQRPSFRRFEARLVGWGLPALLEARVEGLQNDDSVPAPVAAEPEAQPGES